MSNAPVETALATTPMLPLPPREMRVGGKARQDDEAYLQSAVAYAMMLRDRCNVTSESAILDLGCGQARLLYGLQGLFGVVRRYVGVDVKRRSIDWLVETILPLVPWAEFVWSDYPNERYNPKGRGLLELPEGPFDCIALWSVFTHMRLADVHAHLTAAASVAAPKGHLFASIFVDEDVPPETENPAGWLRQKWSGPLHCVRFNRETFEATAEEAGWTVANRDHPRGAVTYSLRRAA